MPAPTRRCRSACQRGAAFATGKYGHSTHHWDNATPYTGDPYSWGHALQAEGLEVGSIGKLHYRNVDDDVGLDFQVIPMHVVNGVGDVLGCVREPLPKRWKSHAMAEMIGPGESSYTKYDRNIAEESVEWICRKAGSGGTDKPWTVFVSFVAPHFPLIAPEEFYAFYADSGVMPTKPVPEDEHEWHAGMRGCTLYDNFTPESTRIALASYYGLVSFMDANIGRVLDALDDAGLTDSTRIIYTSDHGDNIGERGMWGKSNMYEEAAGVPLIMAGPGIPEYRVCRTPVNLTDVYPTILKSAGLDVPADRPGNSLVDIANEADNEERVAFSEYHAMGAKSGAFMIRKGHWKLIHYVGLPSQLFDLDADPDEAHDLGQSDDRKDVRAELMAELCAICDPDEVDRQAKADQRAIVEKHGGVEAVLSKGGFGATPPPGEKGRICRLKPTRMPPFARQRIPRHGAHRSKCHTKPVTRMRIFLVRKIAIRWSLIGSTRRRKLRLKHTTAF